MRVEDEDDFVCADGWIVQKLAENGSYLDTAGG